MSKAQHESDLLMGVPHHPDGGCLNRHIGVTPKKGNGDPCSYRWQAYEKMKETKTLYDWEKYKSLHYEGEPQRTAQKQTKKGGMFPKYYKAYIEPPEEKEWDVTGNTKNKGTNFQVHCCDPYWHEAHHVVPNSTLAGAIAEVGEGKFTINIRRGLAGEKYNLNDKLNMIMLPMDKPISKVLGLPRHRRTATVRSHKGYSRKVGKRLGEILSKLETALEQHEAPKYENVKSDIEALSRQLFDAIKTSEAAALDHMADSEFSGSSGSF